MMKVVSMASAKADLKSVLDEVVNAANGTIITRRDAPNAIVLSLDYYRGVLETLHLLKSPENTAHLNRSIQSVKEGLPDGDFFLMGRKLAWTEAAWSDYVYWQGQDKKTLKRINLLIADTLKTPYTGTGKPEMLRDTLSGFWSRRIDELHRLLYAVDGRCVIVVACRYHYAL